MPTNERIRVYDLARELGLSNKELLTRLEKEGCAVKSHSSALEGEIADMIRDMYASERQKKAAALVDLAEKASPEKESAPSDSKESAAVSAEAVEKEDEGKKELRELHLKSPVTVRDLAEGLKIKPNELITKLMMMNIFAAINQVLDDDKVNKLCEMYGVRFVRVRRERPSGGAPVAKHAKDGGIRSEHRVPRPPVVVFMGHVDHGKTSIQDYIRKTRVAAGEAGGITQAIGASVAQVGKQTITFLDTPGHEAFTAMRARGANATDVAVLVVAADDGVMPQTIEAIHHAQAAKVPIVVAMNKMDLPGADPDKVMRGLQQNGILPEDWGGNAAVIPVSAKTGMGIDDLLERILLEAEMLQLSADPDAPFKGLVIEAQMETGMGPTANIIVQEGTIRVGDVVLCGKAYGRVKALVDSQGRRVAKALPATPIKVMGLSGVPEAGEVMSLVEDERSAKEQVEERLAEERAAAAQQDRMTTLENFLANMDKEEKPNLSIILKTDVRGSLEAISDCISKIKSDRVTVTIVHGGVGEVTENDVTLAVASKAFIIGFHVRAMPGVNKLAKQKGVDIRLYSIIYELLDEVKNAMRGQLAPVTREQFLGKAEIIQIFENSKVGRICGCKVSEGLIRVNAHAKVYRDRELIYHGQISSLKRFKDDVREVKSGLDCGIHLDNFEDFVEHDTIEVYEVVQEAAEL